MDLQQILSSIGLSEKQSQIYLALLELGSAGISEIAQKAEQKRTNIYNLITEMKAQGLVSEIKKGKGLIYSPCPPENLIAKAKNNLQNIESALPEFLGRYNSLKHKPKIKFYEGVAGIKTTYQQLLKTKKPIFAFGDYEKMFSWLDEKYLWTIPEERAQKKINYYVIANNGPRGREVQAKDKEQLRTTKLTTADFETEVNISDNKVAMISLRRPGSAVIIEDAAIAKTMKIIWQTWWDKLK